MAVPGKKTSQTFSAILSRGGAQDHNIFCKQCNRDDIRLPAFGYCVDCDVHLCQTCFNTHRRPKPLRNHQLLDKDHMPQKQDLSKSFKSTSGPQHGDLSKPCTKHTKEVIKFYCHDHNALICSVCVTLDHTPTSCHVNYIPDISEQTLDSMEIKETLKDIDKLTDKYCKITKDLKQRVAKSTTSLKDAIVEIENFRKQINTKLNELENEVKDTAAKIQHDNNNKLKATETICDDINKSLQVSADSLKHLNTNKKTDQLFIDLKITQQLIRDHDKIITQLPANDDIDEYIFEPNQDITKFLQNEKSLGILRIKEQRQSTEPKNKATVPMKMSNSISINVETSSDKYVCYLTGITVSPLNQLFLADCNNYSIKMIDIESGSIKQLQLESSSWDISMVTRNKLVLTLPTIKTIQFISFSSNSFTLENKMTVDGHCHGISHHQGKLAVTFLYSAKLQIMDLIGNIQITVEKDSNGDRIFSDPWYVTTNSHSIYVSDIGKNEVISLNWRGEMIGKNADIGSPRGISLFDDGSLFVSDYLAKCIYRVSGDSKDRAIVLENVQDPGAVFWCSETSTLCVSTITNTEWDNHIKLYKMM